MYADITTKEGVYVHKSNSTNSNNEIADWPTATDVNLNTPPTSFGDRQVRATQMSCQRLRTQLQLSTGMCVCVWMKGALTGYHMENFQLLGI